MRKGVPDMSTFVLAQQREAANLGYAYPAQFSDHVFEGADGERIAASIGLHEGVRRPGLIVVHGLFSSRRFDYVREIAVRAYFEWGFNVARHRPAELRPDQPDQPGAHQRPAGRRARTSSPRAVPEGARGDHGRRARNLARGLVGARRLPPRGRRRGAWTAASSRSPRPSDPRAMAKRLSVQLPPTHPAYALNRGFWAMLTSRIRQEGWEGVEDFVDPIERISAPYYEVEPEELWRRAAAREHIADAKVPVLVLHPKDDEIIPVEQAEELAEPRRPATNSCASGSWRAAATARSTRSTARGSTRSRAVSSSAGPGTRRARAPGRAMSARSGRTN